MEESEGSTVDEIVIAVKATQEVIALIFPPDNEVITDKDGGDQENVIRKIYFVIRSLLMRL